MPNTAALQVLNRAISGSGTDDPFFSSHGKPPYGSIQAAPQFAAGFKILSHSRFMPRSLTVVLVCACFLVTPGSFPQASQWEHPSSSTLSKELLSYEVEWRLIYAGEASLGLEPVPGEWVSKVHLESAGLVSKLYTLNDNYETRMTDGFCARETKLDALERSRHRSTDVTYDYARGKASYTERDLVKNSVFKTAETEIPACVSEIIGSLYKLRTLQLRPGQSAQLQLSDGKKVVSARVEAQAEEKITTKAGTFNTIRCEAYVFNGVLYARKAQLLIWLADDATHTPVQIRARMGFPVGAITLTLEKQEHP